MKLVFSEYKSDYSHYIFPYAVWAFPQGDEKPAEILHQGFLPSSYNLDRFYMCRHVRIALNQYQPSSENRRILRKGEGVVFKLIKRQDFELTPQRKELCLEYADAKFGANIMTSEKLERLFGSPVCSHVLLFTDAVTNEEIGLVVLYMEPPRAVFYYYAFYDLSYPNKSLGMYMMTAAVGAMKEQGYNHIYLGSCYSRNAMYKTQFKGFEFWNGFRWSDDSSELKYLIKRDGGAVEKHLLETEEYMQTFYLEGIV